MNCNRFRAAAFGLSLAFSLLAGASAAQELEPILPRVNVQADSARLDQIVDGEWVAVGTRKAHAIQHDYTRPYGGKPSYRFELKADDNTLSGYAPGETKGRAELSYCYATAADFASLTEADYDAAHRMKTVYHRGKGISPQGSSREYRFAVYIPDDLSPDVCTIFAQWHGMPDRTLTQSPEGVIRRLSVEEFLELESRMVFKKDTGYDKLEGVDKKGHPRVAKEPNGWKVEQGGYPPLAFGFQKGLFISRPTATAAGSPTRATAAMPIPRRSAYSNRAVRSTRPRRSPTQCLSPSFRRTAGWSSA